MKLTKAQKAPFRAFGRIGGKARAANLTPLQRAAAASWAAKVRWDRHRVKKQAEEAEKAKATA